MQSSKKSAKKNKFERFVRSNHNKFKFEGIHNKLKDEIERRIQEFVDKMDKFYLIPVQWL